MALINCPECNREVSDKAEVCLNCGFGVAKYVERQNKIAKIQEEAEKEAYLYVKRIKQEEKEKAEREKREEENKKNSIYNEAVSKYASESSKDVKKAEELFSTILGWKDSDVYLNNCKDRISELIQQEIVQEETYKRRKKKIIFTAIAIGICVGIFIGGYNFYKKVVVPQNIYESAMNSMQDGDYEEAIEKLNTIVAYKDAAKQIDNALEGIYERNFFDAKELVAEHKYSEALEVLKQMEKDENVNELIRLCDSALKYEEAVNLAENGKYREAVNILKKIEDFKDSANILIKYRLEADYLDAINYINSEDYENAVLLFENLGDYKDAKAKKNEISYQLGINAYENKNYGDAKKYLEKVDDDKNIADILSECELQVSYENLYSEADASMRKGNLNDALNSLKQLPSDYKDVATKIGLYNKYKNVLGKWKCVGHDHHYIGYGGHDETRWIADEGACEVYDFIVNIDDNDNLYLISRMYFDYDNLQYTGTVLSWNSTNTTHKLDISTGNLTYGDGGKYKGLYTHSVE